ncbi:HAD family phosphatase [Acidovorax sp. sif1233]|uniref:HAD family hydrolase n=1 Tax=Acidovorax sp. sif1233 TaxID=2854792 RepID=UPI00210608F9|nr:HAD-IA family hydrolase [Acidovorax sp. sif1233]
MALRACINAARAHSLLPAKAGYLQVVGRALPESIMVASSSRRDEIEHRLGRMEVLHHFQALAGCNEVERSKTDPALYRLAAARLEVEPAQCLAFEDSENGACAAQAAGVAVVVVPDLEHPAAGNSGAHAMACANRRWWRRPSAALVSPDRGGVAPAAHGAWDHRHISRINQIGVHRMNHVRQQL